MPDFIHIEESDYSKWERSSGPGAAGPAAGGSRDKLAEEVFPCECRRPAGHGSGRGGAAGLTGVGDLGTVACGARSNCINRALFVECRAQDCPAGEHCQNQR